MNISQIEDYVISKSQVPDLDSEGYDTWIECRDVVPFLASLGEGDVPVLVSTPYFYLFAMLIPLDSLIEDYKTEMSGWNFSPSRGWTFWVSGADSDSLTGVIDESISFTGSTILDTGEPVVFLRQFAARNPEVYAEPNQKILQVADAHWLQERGAYSRLDQNSDLVDVFKTRDLPDGLLCTMEAESLDRYMFGSEQALVFLFDFGRTRHRGLLRFSHPEMWEEKIAVQEGSLVAELEIDRTPERIEESRLRGFQILHELPGRRRFLSRYRTNKEQVPFIIHDWKHGVVREYPGDPVTPSGTPVEEDWPELISPAFFRPEVLSKYRADPAKYELTDTTIDCRGSWFLRFYDVNSEGQVHAWLKDLWSLPYNEQLYWKSFNEEPTARVSERVMEQEILRSPPTAPDPLQDLRQLLLDFPKATHNGVEHELWSSGGADPRKVFAELHYVRTESRKEWQDQILELSNVLLEGLQEGALRAVARVLGCDDAELRSIKLLRRILVAAGADPDTVAAIHDPLAELNTLRSKSGKAHRGSYGPTAYYVAHYRELLEDVTTAMRLFADQVRAGTFDLPR